MSNHDDFDENASKRTFTAPYTGRHPVPTIQGYQARKEERQADSEATAPEPVKQEAANSEQSKAQSTLDSAKSFLHIGSSSQDPTVNEQEPYNSVNRNVDHPDAQDGETRNDRQEEPKAKENKGQNASDQSKGDSALKDTSEAVDSTLDPRQKRKNMKHMKRDNATREVTDPVTHLPVVVHDSTHKELKTVPENEPPAGSDLRSSTSWSAKSKNPTQIEKDTQEEQADHRGMEKLFPPPNFDVAREEIASIYTLAFSIGLGSVLTISLLLLVGSHLFSGKNDTARSWPHLLISSSILVTVGFVLGGGMIWALQGWLRKRIHGIWDDELWDAARNQEQETANSPIPESTQWLNSLLSSVWSLINPDLFTSLADTLEDVMQASLPKLVRMISVEDLGQGSEAIRILGIRWLPTGAAAQNVSTDGKIKSDKGQESDRKVSGEGEVDDDTNADASKGDSGKDDESSQGDEKKETGDDENIAEGMEAEEGDFVNMEVAFSYRASSSGKGLEVKSKNAHLFLAFYLPGGIRFREHMSYFD